MSHLEDIPTPDNGYYVLVTGANRSVYLPHMIVHSIDWSVVALGLVSEPA
jgi:hypothetical protein